MDYGNIKSIRILPNDKRNFETKKDFRVYIQSRLPKRGGVYYFANQMMNCPDNTFVLFQYDSMIRATGVLISREKAPVVDEEGVKWGGYYRFEVSSLHYLAKPIDKLALKKAYPGFGGFNQSKQIIPSTYWDTIFSLLQDCDPYYLDDSRILIKKIDDEIKRAGLKGETIEAFVKARVNQGVFRDKLTRRYNSCCLCGMSNSSLLMASHIKPWSVSQPSEKLDVDNGFLMCPNHDKLFDQGWITFDDNGDIIVSDDLSDLDRVFMNIRNTMKIQLTEKNKAYLTYHRTNIFKNKHTTDKESY